MNAERSQSHGTTIVECLLVGLVNLVCRFPYITLLLTLGLAGVSTYAFCAELKYYTNRNDLISPNKDYQQRWKAYLKEFGNDDDIVVVFQGKDRERMKQVLESVASDVKRHPELFDRLFYKVDIRSLQDRALMFLPIDQIEQIQSNLKSMSLLLELGPIGWRSLTLFRLLHEARERSGKIEPGKPLTPADSQYLTQLLSLSRSAKAMLDNPKDYRNPWNSLLPSAPDQAQLMAEPQYFFSGDGTLAFLLTRPIVKEASFTGAEVSVKGMAEIVASTRANFPDVEIGMTGLPVLETDEMMASQQDTQTASWLALVGVAVLYLIVFRGIRYPFMTMATLLTGTAWAGGWLTLTVGHLNILSATFAMMLIGLGDYGILWVTRYEQDRASGFNVFDAMRNTAASVGPGILTAGATTALAFFAAMLADFQAVAELGWIAGSGVLLCAVACFTVMPALLVVTDRRRVVGMSVVPESSQAAWLPLLARKPRLVICMSLALTIIVGYSAFKVHYDHNLLHLQAYGLESVQWEQKLIDRTAGASWHALSSTTSQQEALVLKARFEQLPEVARVVELASLIPLDQGRKKEHLADIQFRLRRLPEQGKTIPHAFPDPGDLKTEVSVLVGQLQPLADVSPEPLLHDLRRSLVALRDKIDEVSPLVAKVRLQEFEQFMTGDLIQDLHRLRAASKPGEITLADIPPEFRDRYYSPNGKWLLRVFGKASLWEFGPLEHFCRVIQTVDSEATGKPFTTLEGLRGMKSGFLWAGIYALGAILFVLVLDFRKPTHILAALAPLAMGMLITLGIMGICGLDLNPANMIAFPLIIGVGVDNGVHVLHDFLSRRDKDRRYLLSHNIGQGIFVAALTTILGFGVLTISRHQGLFGLGLILTLGVTCCMVSALIFLPAVLRLSSKRRSRKAAHELPPQQHVARAA
jgi:hopanoid biosynthesis associated RND transporter like protein HpnN